MEGHGVGTAGTDKRGRLNRRACGDRDCKMMSGGLAAMLGGMGGGGGGEVGSGSD